MNTSSEAGGGTGAVLARLGRHSRLLRRLVIPLLIFCGGAALTVMSYYELREGEQADPAHLRHIAEEHAYLPYSTLVLVAGLLLSGLGAIYLVQLGRHAARRERLVAEALEANEKLSAEIDERTRAESALRVARDKAQSYLDLTGTMFIAIDADETVTLINPMGCEILGCREDDILGANWFDLVLPAQVRETVRSVFRQLIAGEVEGVESFENTILAADGTERIIAWHNSLLRDADGNITGTLSSGLDVTERRKTEQALAERGKQFQTLVDYAPDAILLYDGDQPAINGCSSRPTPTRRRCWATRETSS
ncbi:MAG: PAS domain-containing protein [Planctomycetota bacterium]